MRNISIWLPSYIKQCVQRKPPLPKPAHVIFCIVDHFEPRWGKVGVEKEIERVDTWLDKYPTAINGHGDSEGNSPKHTFFYPIDEYTPEAFKKVDEFCKKGFGEIEIQLHHDNDTPHSLAKKLEEGKALFGKSKYGFVHGNWALDNSRKDGRWCGVNNELTILKKTGCYADFTLPSAPSDTQTSKINSIYYATDTSHPKSHNTGVNVEVGKNHNGDLMIIQGPLTLDWGRRKIENSGISLDNPPTKHRIDLWVGQRIGVIGRPEWIFVKVYTHGAQDENLRNEYFNSLDSMFDYLEEKYNDGLNYKLHYVTAREMYNIIKAAEADEKGELKEYRDYNSKSNTVKPKATDQKLEVRPLINTGKKIPSLDGLRAVSILLVILSHVSYVFPKVLFKYFNFKEYGTVGVTMFFVISGFLITTLLLNEKFLKHGKVDIKKFYIRRAFRILPVSFLYVTLILLFNKTFDLKIENATFGHAISYTMNFMVLAAPPWLLGHLWSLGVEEQFYAFWPWVSRRSLKTITLLAFIIIAYAPIVRVITYGHPNRSFITLSPFFEFADCLMIGCLLAISRYTLPNLWKSPILGNWLPRLLAIFSIWFIPYLWFLDSKHFHADYFTVPFGTTVISIATAYIIVSTITFKNSRMFKFLNHPLVVYVGILSYSIYIWQQLFLGARVIPNLPSWWRAFPVNVLLTLCVSILSYHLWEKGFLKLKEKFKVV